MVWYHTTWRHCSTTPMR